MGIEVQSIAADPWSAAAIEHNRHWLGAYLLALSGDAEGAADMVQEVFAVALAKRGDFRPGTNFGGWLRVIARHVALRRCRRRGRELLVDRADILERFDRAAESAAERSAEPGCAEERAGLLRECLARLSGRVRRMLELRYGQDRTPVEVAAAVGLNVSAANMALCRARFALAECIRRKSDRSFRQGVTG